MLCNEGKMDVVEAWEKRRKHETLENYFAKIEDELAAYLPPKKNTRVAPGNKVCTILCFEFEFHEKLFCSVPVLDVALLAARCFLGEMCF